MESKKAKFVRRLQTEEYVVFDDIINDMKSWRLYVGERLYKLHQEYNRNRTKKTAVSRATFFRISKRAFPFVSMRTPEQYYRVYQYFVAEGGLEVYQLQDFRHVVLFKVVQDGNIRGSILNTIFTDLYKQLQHGEKMQNLEALLWVKIDRRRSSLKRLSAMIEEYDARFVTVLYQTRSVLKGE